MKFPKIDERIFLIFLILTNLLVRFWRIADPPFAYFDESKFYLPAARELLARGIDPLFEHPPLAKLLFAFSINLFGDNSFGWRFFPVVFSVLSVLIIYFLAKKLFNNRLLASVAAILFSLDFGWFTTSRLAVPETIAASFLLLSSYFVIVFYKDNKNQLGNLILGSLFFGLALSTKWSVLLLLPVFLFLLIYKLKDKLRELFLKTALLLLVSLLVYIGSFGFFLQKNSLEDLLSLHKKMLTYHSQTVNEIVKEKPDLQMQEKQYKAVYWPMNNIFSYRFEQREESLQAVVFFYNPVILWGSLFVCGLVLWKLLKRKKVELAELFLAGSFLIFWIAFLFSPRIVYPYYWVSGVPFGSILLARYLVSKNKKENLLLLGLTITATLLFAIYYPILSNMPVKIDYFQIITGTIGFD